MRRFLIILMLALLTACGGSGAATVPIPVAPTAPQATLAAIEPAAETTLPAATTEPDVTEMPVLTDVPATMEPIATELPATAAATANDAPSGAPKDVLLGALRAQQQAGPYHISSVIETESGPMRVEGDIVPPDKVRLTTTSDAFSRDMIIIGETLWTKDGDTWTSAPGGGMITTIMAQYTQDPEAMGIAITNVQYVGPELLESTPTWVYTYDSVFGEGGQAMSASSKLWISIVDGLPLQQESTGAGAGITSTTTQRFTYDSSITIEAPTP